MKKLLPFILCVMQIHAADTNAIKIVEMTRTTDPGTNALVMLTINPSSVPTTRAATVQSVFAAASRNASLSGVTTIETLSLSNKLNATNIATGLISNTEFNYLNGLTGNIQDQIDGLGTAGAFDGATISYNLASPRLVDLGTIGNGATATLSGTNNQYTGTFSGATATIALPASPSNGVWIVHGTSTYGSGEQIITVPALIRPEYDADSTITTFTNAASAGSRFTAAFTALNGAFVKFSVIGDAYSGGGGTAVGRGETNANYLVYGADTNSLANELVLTAGTNITVRTNGSTLVLDVPTMGGSGGGGETNANYVVYDAGTNTLANELVLTAGGGISLVKSGSTIIVSNTLSGGTNGNPGSQWWQALDKTYALVLTNQNGSGDWAPVRRAMRARRVSTFMPSASTYGLGSFSGEYLQANGSPTVLVEATAGLPSAMKFVGAASINSEVGLDAGGYGMFYTGKNIHFACGYLAYNTNACRDFIGLSATGRDNTVGGDNPNYKYVGFQYSDSRGDTTWKFITSNGAASVTLLDTGVAVAANTHYQLEIVEDVVGGNWIAIINGSPVMTNHTDVPTSTKLGTIICKTILENVAKSNAISFFECSSDW